MIWMSISTDFIRMYNMRLTSLITCDFALRSSDPRSLTSSSGKRSPSPSVTLSRSFRVYFTCITCNARQCFGLAHLLFVHTLLPKHPPLLFSSLPPVLSPSNIHLFVPTLHQSFDGTPSQLLHTNHTLPLAYSSKRTHKHNMASWETDASTGGGAADAGFGDTAAQPADTTNDTLDMTPLAGAFTEAETAAFRERAREAGWVDSQPVDYAVRQSSHDTDMTNYLAHSAVYEWDDEYGDVGPEVPALEQQLFGGDFRVRQGQFMNELQFEVTVEGPDKLQPARSVSTLLHSLPLHVAHR
jgi:hypothetical protein